MEAEGNANEDPVTRIKRIFARVSSFTKPRSSSSPANPAQVALYDLERELGSFEALLDKKGIPFPPPDSKKINSRG